MFLQSPNVYCTSLLTFLEIIIKTGEPASKPQYINYCLKSEVAITLHYQLCIQPITNQNESRNI